ncbi:uncharacterized protein LOC127846676 [Dreissena polymorpha]|uniref:Uncharacterized protein n=1 Tax=Dreissena polymorpha TaxID=45954 RepID=A0A9D4E4B3_DREPO|nr:uncharacterized protein LOC127846676 [Dreissena polymorpha]KAH3771929.1 hypothetical protein DPMN_173258 [Dreissena polymorpha]
MRQTVLVILVAIGLQSVNSFTPDSQYAISTVESNVTQRPNDNHPFCEFAVTNISKTYFKNRIHWYEPDFITFQLTLLNDSFVRNATQEVFHPDEWFWTYNTSHGEYPYLYLNFDFGLLTFGLLEQKTEHVDFVRLNVTSKGKCVLSIGDNSTNTYIAHALSEIFDQVGDEDLTRFKTLYFCYMSIDKNANRTWAYTAGVYFNYPVPFIQYTCCIMKYNYYSKTFIQSTCSFKPQKWSLCTIGPYVIGIIIFLYFPIVLFRFFHTLTSDELIQSYDHELLSDLSTNSPSTTWLEDTWIFLDGNSPLTLSYLASSLFSGFKRSHPVMFSRFRRLFCLILVPTFLFLKVLLYRNGTGKMGYGGKEMKIMVQDIVGVGTPIGFLSILGNSSDARKTFVPFLGGPFGMLGAYLTIGIVLIVMPRSLKQIVENGMPRKRKWSTLFLSVDEILRMAMLKPKTEPGYHRAAAVFTGSFYMLFNRPFWHKLFYEQKMRFSYVWMWSKSVYMFVFLFLVLLSAFEIFVCVVYNLIPFFNFAVISVKGAVLTIVAQRRYCYINCARVLFNSPLAWLIVLICSGLFTIFAYTLCLIYIESFMFISQITIMCFVAVIVTPTTAFGFLFFVLVLVVYLAKLARGFGDVYFDLLSIAIEKSLHIEAPVNQIFIQDGNIEIPNICARHVKSIRIKGTILDVSDNTLQKINRSQVQHKTMQRGNTHGIPKDLFKYLIERHRPVHIQVLKVIFRFALIITLIALANAISFEFSTPETSEVMHVIFVVSVGALPHLFEIMMEGSEVVKRQLEEAEIEQSILRYWRARAELDVSDVSWP